MHFTMCTTTRTRQDKKKNTRFELNNGTTRRRGGLTQLSPCPRHHYMPSKSPTLPRRAKPYKRTAHPRATLPPPPSRPCLGIPRAAPLCQSRARRPQRVRRLRLRGRRGGPSWGGRRRGGRGHRGRCRDGRARCARGAQVGGEACVARLRTGVRGRRAHAGGVLLLRRRRHTMVGTK